MFCAIRKFTWKVVELLLHLSCSWDKDAMSLPARVTLFCTTVYSFWMLCASEMRPLYSSLYCWMLASLVELEYWNYCSWKWWSHLLDFINNEQLPWEWTLFGYLFVQEWENIHTYSRAIRSITSFTLLSVSSASFWRFATSLLIGSTLANMSE